MSQMIPDYFYETVSEGERKLFAELRNLSNDYTILHSLGLAEHYDKVYGEIDFVIVGPEGVLCLEVKGGDVRREAGEWISIDRYGNEHRDIQSPYKQVQAAMHSLRKEYVGKHFGTRSPLVDCQYACGVAFPDTAFIHRGPEIIPEIIYDLRTGSIEDYIKKVFAYWRNQLKQKHGFSGGTLTRNQIHELVSYLRGDFRSPSLLGEMIRITEDKLEQHLIVAQRDVLRASRNNPRILLEGPAGTGKTLISMAVARHRAHEGKRVLYLCYNSTLAQHLRYELKKSDPKVLNNLTVNTFHNFLKDEIERTGFYLPEREGPDNQYFQKDLPERFVGVAEQSLGEKYDMLIVDEGQDLFRLNYLACLDFMVHGGLNNGSWFFCYDENQNIYNDDLAVGLELLKEHRPYNCTLTVNCRNTRPVGEQNVLLTKFPPAECLKVGGEPVVLQRYQDADDERRKLKRRIRELIGQGINPGSIFLLSKYGCKKSCLQGNKVLKGIGMIQDITRLDPELISDDSIKFCTIHSFKGLEAPIVFLLDVHNVQDEVARRLNYTAISRAKSLLYILYDQSIEDELRGMVDSSRHLIETVADKPV